MLNGTATSRVLPPPMIPPNRRGLGLIFQLRRDPLQFFTDLMVEEGSYAWMNLNGTQLLMMNDAAGIAHVLQDNADNYRKGRFNKVLKYFLGRSMFLSEGNVWRQMRRESAPAFATGNLDAMIADMMLAVEAMFERWQPRIERQEPIDIGAEMMSLTLDVVLRALFHESRENVASQLQRSLGLLLSEAEGRIWSPLNVPQSVVLRLPKYRDALGFIRELVHELIAARQKNNAYPSDLLSRLIAAYGLTADTGLELRDQVMAFLLAGHETTAHGLTWSLYNLARHPAQDGILQREIEEVLPPGPVTLADISKLHYTRQVFDEALRLYPPVWTLSREALAEDAIPLDSGEMLSIPKDTVVMLCCYAVQRREKYWQNPEAFDPDRFSSENSRGRPKFAWFPFGGGPRLCLGIRFAQIESVLALALIKQRYTLALLPGQQRDPVPVITLRPNGPMLFRVRERRSVVALQSTVAGSSASSDVLPALLQCPFHRVAH